MAQTHKNYRYYHTILVAFVTLLLCSNLIGAAKVCEVGGFTFGGTLLFFPITYLFGDILTEVYGYEKSRVVVWSGFGAMIFASFVAWVVLALPPAPEWNHQTELETIFGQTPRLVVGSLVAYFIGEFSNSYVLAKMKVSSNGKHLWVRLIGSTLVGEALDTCIFFPIAFFGLWPQSVLIKVMGTSYVFKVLWEFLMIPFTYRIVNFLKKAEHEDHYDTHTNFSPFHFQ